MELEQHNAFLSAFVLRNLKEAFQQENIGVLLFFAVVFFFNGTADFELHSVSGLPHSKPSP